MVQLIEFTMRRGRAVQLKMSSATVWTGSMTSRLFVSLAANCSKLCPRNSWRFWWTVSVLLSAERSCDLFMCVVSLWIFCSCMIHTFVSGLHSAYCLQIFVSLSLWCVRCVVQTGHADMNLPRVSGHCGPITDIKWSPLNDSVIASSSEDTTVCSLIFCQ